MLNLIRSWLVVAGLFLQLFAHRLGLCKAPRCADYQVETVTAYASLVRLGTRMRVLGGEHCPRGTPAVFVGNHIKLDDPGVMLDAMLRETGSRAPIRFMMRDDFFAGLPWIVRWLDVDDMARQWGAIQISRDNVQYAQLKPFVKVLIEGTAFMMYNGRSRSRSGMFIEYRNGITEPGSVAFFLAHAQRRQPGLRIPAVPVVRTFNPVTKGSTVAFGPPMFLSPEADRAAQRAFDLEVAARMGDLVEVNVPQVLSGILYLRCLHHRPPAVGVSDLCQRLDRVFKAISGRRVDPAARTDLEREVRRSLRYLAKGKMLRLRGDTIELDTVRTLACPPLDNSFKKTNPTRYFANQILHLTDVTAQIERAALMD